MRKGCGQVIIPTVDNSELDCPDFVKSKCVKLNFKSIYLTDIKDPSLYDFLVKFDNIIKDLRKDNIYILNKISNLEREIEKLKKNGL